MNSTPALYWVSLLSCLAAAFWAVQNFRVAMTGQAEQEEEELGEQEGEAGQSFEISPDDEVEFLPNVSEEEDRFVLC